MKNTVRLSNPRPAITAQSKVPKKDRPSGATLMRILARVLQRYGHLYELQTKHSILHSRYGAQNLNQVD